jgi:hypothetical protein
MTTNTTANGPIETAINAGEVYAGRRLQASEARAGKKSRARAQDTGEPNEPAGRVINR